MYTKELCLNGLMLKCQNIRLLAESESIRSQISGQRQSNPDLSGKKHEADDAITPCILKIAWASVFSRLFE